MQNLNHQHLAQELTRFFTRPFSRELTRDFACRLICKILGASSVSILIYSSLKDALVCKGRYISLDAIDIDIDNENIALYNVLKNIQICEFIHSHLQESKSNTPKAYQRFCDYFKDEEISAETFQQHCDSYDFWKDAYLHLKETYRSENYPIDNNSISGNYYKDLLDDKQAHEIYLTDFQQEPYSKQLAKTLIENELKITLIGHQYYVAIPLKVSNRYFGLMRFIFNEEKGIYKNEYGQLKMDIAMQERIEYIAQSIALQSDNSYYYDGFRSFNFQSLEESINNEKNLEEYLKKQCNAFAKIINCKGTIIRIWNQEGKDSNIKAFSKGMNEYVDYLKAKKSLGFDKKMIEKFKDSPNVLAAYFDNCLKHPFKVIEYYDFDKDGNIDNKEKIWEVRSIASETYLQDLKKLKIEKIAVLPIPFLENSFILFFNSQNRIFLPKDIEMVHQAVRRMGLEIKNYYDNISIKKRMDVITKMHTELNALLNDKENGYNRQRYIQQFLSILATAIEKLNMFEAFIFWEYVSENLPSEKDKAFTSKAHVFRSIYPFNKDIVKIKNNDNSPHLNNTYTTVCFTEKEFNLHVLDYASKGECLLPIIPLETKGKEYCHFDTVVSTKSNMSLDGLISFIYKETDTQNREDTDFISFMRFFSSQISIAWNKLLDNIILDIEDKIDKIKIDYEKYEPKTMKKELIEIANILADEFSCDLCCLFLKDEEKNTLKLEVNNLFSLPKGENIVYNLERNSEVLSVKSLIQREDYRIFGRAKTESLTNQEKLEQIEEHFKQNQININEGNQETTYLVEHWLSAVLNIGDDTSGLIKLFQIKPVQKGEDKLKVKRHPFSEFESILLKKIQKHIFNIVAKHQLFKNRRLHEKQRRKDRRDNMQNIIHQVVAPLNALINHCINLSRGYIPSHKIQSKLLYTAILARISAKHAGGFQQILELEEDKIEVKKKRIFDLRLYWIQKAIDFQPLAQKKGITIHVKEANFNNKISVELDTDLFSHAAFNLLDNAVKYSFKAKQRKKHGFKEIVPNNDSIENIQISVVDKGTDVEINISNCGLEIPEKDRKHVFKRDFRSFAASEYSATGSGIGLYLVKKIIKLHGAKIKVIKSYHKNITIIQILLPKK